jgi:hypothetical protein
MLDLRKLLRRERLHRRDPLEADSDYPSSQRASEGLEVEYEHVVGTQFRRWHIAPEAVRVQIRKLGEGPDGFEVFVAMVRLVKWHRASALRLLLGLPMLEARVRRSIRSTWLADVSHFAGLWVHASDSLELGEDRDEVRELLASLKTPVPDSGVDSRAGTDSVAAAP